MSLEAVPCVLKQSDGSPVYGLLIRPSTGAPAPPQPTPLSSPLPRPPPISPRLSGPKQKPILPAPPPPAHKDPSLGGNVFIPASAVQQFQATRGSAAFPSDGAPAHSPAASTHLPSTSYASPSCSGSGDFGLPPPHALPSQSIGLESSLNYSQSGGNSNMELASLLEDINSSDLASLLADSEKMLSSDCTLLDPSHPTSSTALHSGSSTPSLYAHSGAPCEGQSQSMATEQPRPACRYSEQQPSTSRGLPPGEPRPQLGWERGPSDSASTPDSGIQSISGSPPSHAGLSPAAAQFSPQFAAQPSPAPPPPPPAPLSQPLLAEPRLDDPEASLDDMPQLVPEGCQDSEEAADEAPAPGPASPPKASSPPPVSLDQRVEGMDARFEQVCLRVLQGSLEGDKDLQPSTSAAKPPLAKKSKKRKQTPTQPQTVASKGPPKVTEAANQTSSSPASNETEKNLLLSNAMSPQPPPDPKTIVEKLLNQLEPTQLHQFTKLFEEKLRQSNSESTPAEASTSKSEIGLEEEALGTPADRAESIEEPESKPQLSASERLKRRRERAQCPKQLSLRRKLETYRRSVSGHVVNPVIVEAMDRLSNSIAAFELSHFANVRAKNSGKGNFLSPIDWEELPCVAAARAAAIAASRASVANLELEDSGASDGEPSARLPPAPLAEVERPPPQLTPPPIPVFTPVAKPKRAPRKRKPRAKPLSIKVRLKLDLLSLPAKAEVVDDGLPMPILERLAPAPPTESLPPKKRLKALLAADPPIAAPLAPAPPPSAPPAPPAPASSASEPAKAKKRRRLPYPWERKRRKDLAGPPGSGLSFRRCGGCRGWLQGAARLCPTCTSPADLKRLPAGLLWDKEGAKEPFQTGFHVDPSLIPAEDTPFRLPFHLWKELGTGRPLLSPPPASDDGCKTQPSQSTAPCETPKKSKAKGSRHFLPIQRRSQLMVFDRGGDEAEVERVEGVGKPHPVPLRVERCLRLLLPQPDHVHGVRSSGKLNSLSSDGRPCNGWLPSSFAPAERPAQISSSGRAAVALGTCKSSTRAPAEATAFGRQRTSPKVAK